MIQQMKLLDYIVPAVINKGVCPVCGKEFVKKCKISIYCSRKCYHKKYQQTDKYKKYYQSDKIKQYQKQYQKQYRQSDEYKQSLKKYKQSDEYKQNKKQSQKKYQQTDEYKQYLKKYHQTDEFKQYQKQYQQSDKFKQYHKKYYQSDKSKQYFQHFYQNNKDKIKQYLKKYHQTDEFKQYQKQYHQTDEFKQYLKKYQQTDKGKLSQKKQNLKRAERHQKVIHSFTKEQLKQLFDASTFCPDCNRPYIQEIKSRCKSLDHSFSLYNAAKVYRRTGVKVVYGINDVRIVCCGCNSSKRAKVFQRPDVITYIINAISLA